ncbi:diglucosyl diacylglycerol synthase [Priestia taiwanensis]|uniref:Processive diacylglycerol beta-glucosyltransferase n=1 Tax=Priestia taiwanensis TaxID=1347902 RepID=A0A917ETD7_9BACI|nr:diglucosyl diacylglycerol synthase [Priestia taiwanensis]MBM7364640.1 processive 1,2-diacylglycerol beta-glucosyltransferase [Priestia taiwanensis]GGE78441.1 processive diacylglycerol beta-glucosyltransferase [Priestia taiwanensis]
MDTSSKILILTAQYGNGHLQVAKTLKEAFERQGFQHIVVCDLFAESHPIITDITKYLYLKSYTIGKQLYKMFYYGVEKIYNKKIASIYTNFGRKRLASIIESEKPDVIINTFPITAVPALRQQTGYQIPIYNIVTDFCLHKIWMHQEIDKYFVATPRLKEVLENEGIQSEKVEVTGIPIRHQFEVEMEKEAIYKKYGLSPEKKILLIVAGAHGVLKNVGQLCESFGVHEDLQIVVVCGNNEELKNELDALEPSATRNMTTLGYVERIDELFRITDCMITKPGGITLSEAAALQVPVILYRPVPGQENENAIFFQENGAALVIRKHEEVYERTLSLLQDDYRLLQMKKAMGVISQPKSADHIVSTITHTKKEQKIYQNYSVVR